MTIPTFPDKILENARFLVFTIQFLRRRSPHGECGLKSTYGNAISILPWSLPAWGVWIEITDRVICDLIKRSLPAWGVWIEMALRIYAGCLIASLPAWGVWIEILEKSSRIRTISSRSPHGECGLKLALPALVNPIMRSLPAWGVWIEIVPKGKIYATAKVAPRMGSVD